jgi:transketolase
MTVDGHDQAAIDDAIGELWSMPSNAPRALIAKTVKGKGVAFMEHNNAWHYTRLDADTYRRALSAITGKA